MYVQAGTKDPAWVKKKGTVYEKKEKCGLIFHQDFALFAVRNRVAVRKRREGNAVRPHFSL